MEFYRLSEAESEIGKNYFCIEFSGIIFKQMQLSDFFRVNLFSDSSFKSLLRENDLNILTQFFLSQNSHDRREHFRLFSCDCQKPYRLPTINNSLAKLTCLPLSHFLFL
jgi:hypothetical protein